jgi:hypothetical protein
MISKVLLISDSSLTQEPNQEESETDTAESGKMKMNGKVKENKQYPVFHYPVNPLTQMLLGVI